MADEAKFCKHCGTNVQGVAPFVQQPAMQAPALHCMKCGAVLNPGAKFCNACGTPTGLATPVAPVAPAPAKTAVAPVQEPAISDDDDKTIPIPSGSEEVVFATPETPTPVTPAETAPVAADDDDDRTIPIPAQAPAAPVAPAVPAAPVAPATPVSDDDEKTMPITAQAPVAAAAPAKEETPAAAVVDEDDERTVLPSLFQSEPHVQEAVKKAEAERAAQSVADDDDDDEDDRTVPMASQPAPAPVNGPKCSQCGNVVQPGMMFCNFCGAKLDPAMFAQNGNNGNPYAATSGSAAQESKKGGNKVLIIVAVLLIAALFIGGIVAITMGGKNGDKNSGFNLPSFSNDKEEKEAEPETESAPAAESEEDELAAFAAQVESGDYRAVIDSFVSGEGAGITGRDEDVKALVKSALEGEESAFTSEIWNNYAVNGNYADAYTLVEEEKAYFESVSGKFPDAKTQVENLDGLISALRSNHYSAFVENGTNAVKSSDENGLNALIADAAGFFEGSEDFGEAFEAQKKAFYSELILHTAISVHSSGNQVETVNYIYDHLEEGNYHFYMMELYEDSANALGLFSYAASVTQLPNRGDYIFENSDSVVLTDSDLSGKDLNTVRVGLHEIYARHGRTFTNGAIQAYFDSKSWYSRLGSDSGDIHFDENVLNDTERENVKIIVQYMIQKGFLKRAN